MAQWAEGLNRGEPVVLEQNRTKVRLILWGLAAPAAILTLVAVLAPEDVWGHVVPGGAALVLWIVFWIFRSNVSGPDHGRLVVSPEGLELPRKGGKLVPWTDIDRVAMQYQVVCIWLTPEGYQRFYAHLPGWLRTLNLMNLRGLRLPRTFEVDSDRVFALVASQHQRYATP